MLLDNARLVEELRASRARIAEATHEGQVRIERDLHDGVQPHLSALLVKLGIARDLAEEPGAARADRRARRRCGGRGQGAAHARARRLSAAPARARARPGAAGVRGHGAGRRARRGAREPGRRHRRRRRRSTSRSLEAIQNAIKHGGAGRRRSTSRSTAGRERLAFAVVDDGPGFDRRAIEAGVGLVSMEDRIGAAGGELEIRSSPGDGTTVPGWVPAD